MGSLSKTPGDTNQKIMGSFRFGIALLVLTSVATAKDVFRYVDEETGQSHYMTGDPGSSVEGGWTFTNSDGTFELAYKADEAGFQPEAEHIPIPVEDTNEVTGAKSTFYTLYDEHKAKVEAGFVPEAAYIPDTDEVVEAKNTFYSLVEEHKAKVEAAKAEAVVDARRKRSPNDVFRYEDEATGQSHYMTGEPGKAVEGGWTFTNPDGSYELVYKADEGGFQPEAAHIPVSVEDTNEVTEAKTTFYSLYDEHKAKVEAAIAKDAAEAVVDARRKRSPNDVFRYEDEATGQPHYMTGEPGMAVEGGWTFTNPDGSYELVYKADEGGFQPEAAHIPVSVEDTNEVTEAKTTFYSLYDEHKAKVEAAIAKNGDEAVVDARRKRDAHGFYKLHPYYGFVPVEEEPKEVKEFKFLPYHGFVPADETVPGEEALLKNLHPYHKKMAFKKFKLDPYHGFVPIMEEEAPAAVSERKKRD